MSGLINNHEWAITIPEDLDRRIGNAVDAFWTTRAGQITRQQESGTRDAGSRGAVTGGKQLDGFVSMTRDILLMNHIPEDCIFTDSDLELPGYYRPNKKWDLLVVSHSDLIAAIEFKSQVGPSFGNNFNNRTEEAMGSALDLWTACREGRLGEHPPWLGYFMVLEDCKRSNEPVKVRSPHFPVPEEFVNASYTRRYELFCKKLVLEHQYSGACLLTTQIHNHQTVFRFPQSHLSCRMFIASLLGSSVSYFSGLR